MIAGPVTVGPLPTATQLVGDVHATPFRPPLVGSALGFPTTDHFEPFHRSIKVAPELPTAKQVVVVGHDTSASELSVAPGTFGLATVDHFEPFQCSISVFVIDEWAEKTSMEPTAKHDFAARHETESRVGWLVLVRSGPATIDHAFPFQCSVSGCE